MNYDELVKSREEHKSALKMAIKPIHKKLLETKLVEIRNAIKQHIKSKNRI